MTSADKNPAAQALGRLGGKKTSAAKAESARANGAKGGRPKSLIRPYGTSGAELLKAELLTFWERFGGIGSSGKGFSREEKLNALIDLSNTRIPYRKQQELKPRRNKFNDRKNKLHPFVRFGECFVCRNRANHRHHIVQLQHGGINSKKNLVSLCRDCHGKIHPWL